MNKKLRTAPFHYPHKAARSRLWFTNSGGKFRPEISRSHNMPFALLLDLVVKHGS